MRTRLQKNSPAASAASLLHRSIQWGEGRSDFAALGIWILEFFWSLAFGVWCFVHRLPENQKSEIKSQKSSLASAFTLIELLVVIGIIGLLAAMLMPVFSKGALEAKKKTTKVEMRSLEVAITSYDVTYSRFPAKATGASDLTFGYASAVAGVPANSEVMVILMDIPTGVNINHAMNPSGATTFPVHQVSDTNSPGLSTIDYQLRDPWGHPYVITMDLDGDKRCRDAFYSTAVSRFPGSQGPGPGYNGLVDHGNGFELDAPVMIWSLGPDGKYDDSTTAKANAGANKDNILSWQ